MLEKAIMTWDGTFWSECVVAYDPAIFQSLEIVKVGMKNNWDEAPQANLIDLLKNEEESNKFAAQMMLSGMQLGRRIVVPTPQEWIGLGLLERDDQLNRSS